MHIRIYTHKLVQTLVDTDNPWASPWLKRWYKGPSCSELILRYTILGGFHSRFPKVSRSGPVQPCAYAVIQPCLQRQTNDCIQSFITTLHIRLFAPIHKLHMCDCSLICIVRNIIGFQTHLSIRKKEKLLMSEVEPGQHWFRIMLSRPDVVGVEGGLESSVVCNVLAQGLFPFDLNKNQYSKFKAHILDFSIPMYYNL